MIRRLTGLMIVGLAACGRPALKEVSSNFDLDQVRPFLTAVARGLDGGLEPSRIDSLTSQVASLPVEGNTAVDLRVTYRGQVTPMRLEAHMDDVDAPDLALWAPSPLAEHIDSVLHAFQSGEDK